MEPIPVYSLPLPLVSTGRPQRDQGQAKQDLPGKRPGRDEAAEDGDGSVKKDTDQETPRRDSDGIVGTLIDVEG